MIPRFRSQSAERERSRTPRQQARARRDPQLPNDHPLRCARVPRDALILWSQLEDSPCGLGDQVSRALRVLRALLVSAACCCPAR
ncbi:hypothetical protein FM113_16835 [Leucobacter sp. 7(1)]|nr:hypothetical protein FM113_16835 [Leucobacter sp. 7(1)]